MMMPMHDQQLGLDIVAGSVGLLGEAVVAVWRLQVAAAVLRLAAGASCEQ